MKYKNYLLLEQGKNSCLAFIDFQERKQESMTHNKKKNKSSNASFKMTQIIKLSEASSLIL